ncbi:MAG: 2,3,4,5-tetrahydropyridine-2,6-dicarboxylate N-succinyltransferase [Pseudomonadota bacterium]
MLLKKIEDILNIPNEIKESTEFKNEVSCILDELNCGKRKIANKKENGDYEIDVLAQKAILAFFAITKSREFKAGDFHYFDKVPVKTDLKDKNVRVVPQAIVRYGAFIEANVVLMPSYVNIGAYVGAGTMVDTWSTIGSCAQIGKNCHISGGVGIGGVLEPIGARPVIIEDNVFIGARSEIAEGVIVRQGSVISMGVFIGASTKIFDARPENFGKIYIGEVPENSVLLPGSRSKDIYKDNEKIGSVDLYSPVIIKTRDNKTDAKTSLSEVLRK